MERRLEHLVPGIDLSAFLDQVLDKLRVALLYSVVQARLVVRLVYLG